MTLWSKPAEIPANSTLSDFFSRVRAGKIGQAVSLGPAHHVTQRHFKPVLDLSIPSFDFDTSFPASTSEQMWQAMDGVLPVMPFPDYFLAFRRPPDFDQPTTIDHIVLHITTPSEGRFRTQAYTHGESTDIWYEQPVNSTVELGPVCSQMMVHIRTAKLPGMLQVQDDYHNRATMFTDMALLAMILLARPWTHESTNQEGIRMPKRLLGNIPERRRPQQVTRIDLRPGAMMMRNPAASEEPTRLIAPHERRGHTRTLRDGREIPVRPASIHGGTKTPPVYLARR